MTIDVDGPNGISVSFPDGTDSATIHAAMLQATGQREMTDAEVFGPKKGEMSDAEVFGTQRQPRSPQRIEYEGRLHEFPGDFSQADIARALSSYRPPQQPSVAGDVAKQIGAGLVSGAEAIPGFVPGLLNLAGKGLNALAPNLFDQGKTAQQEQLRQAIEANRGGGIAQYLPQPQTTAGQYARTGAEFLPTAAGVAALTGGGLARNLLSGATAGLASEAAGQATQGTSAELPARVVAAFLGGRAGLRTAESVAARRAAQAVPSNEAIIGNATDAYRDLRSANVAQPIAQSELDKLASDITATVNREGPRRSVANAGHNAIDEIKVPGTRGQADVADLVSARQNLKSFFANPMPDPSKAVAAIAIPKIEAAIERLSPGTMRLLKQADADYSAGKTSQALDKRMARADLRAAGEHSGMNLGNRIRQNAASMLLSNKESKGLTDANRAALEQVVRGTLAQNTLRKASNLLGGGGGLGTTLLAGAGLGAGYETGHPELALAGFAGMGLRGLANRLTLNQAKNVDAMIRARSPYAASLGATGPVPRQGSLIAALLAAPAVRQAQ